MAKIRRRAYGPRNEEQRDPKYGKRAGATTGGGQRAYAEKKGRKDKR
jgi:hypothetical protein